MAGALSIEVLDRLGRVKERVRAETFPVVVGRAYSCDVIVDDRYVSPQHLRIERDEEGRLVVEDLQTTNGTQRLAPLGALARAPVENDMRLRLGHTVLRLRTEEHPVDPAARLLGATLPVGLLGNRALSVSICLAVLLFFLLDDYLTYFERFSAARVLSQAAGLVLLFGLWAGTWSLVSRVVTQNFHFLEHCTIAALWALVYDVFVNLTDYYAFALAADRSAEAIAWAGTVPLLAGVLYSHLRLCSAAPPLRLALGTAGVASAVVGLSGLVMLGAQMEEQWPDELAFSWQLKPPVFQLAPSREIDEFFSRAVSLKDRVDRLADE